MRTIKYRKWDKVDKKMSDWDSLKKEPMYLLNESESFVFMQSTGLLGKFEKEIYEGDIIRSTETNEVLKIGEILPLSRHLDMLAENIGYYDGKKYHLRSAGGQYHLDDWVSNPEFYEIIGNIYENKNLLTL